jgi:hypothetical protein
MGRRDFRKHESKKPKKEVKKIMSSEILPTTMSVEVVRKRRKERETSEE